MGLLERCRELFKTPNLYEVLGIKKEASEAEIRRSYYKVSLRVHPDRAPEDPLATEKFQVNHTHTYFSASASILHCKRAPRRAKVKLSDPT